MTGKPNVLVMTSEERVTYAMGKVILPLMMNKHHLTRSEAIAAMLAGVIALDAETKTEQPA